MKEWYAIDIDEIDTPALVVYLDRVKENIRVLRNFVPDVSRLRPHVKTNKSEEISRLLVDEGIMKFKCAHTDLVEIDKLILMQNPKNNNVHSNSQIDRLAKIIDFAGQRQAIVISKRSGFITKGHGRLLAMAKLMVA